MVAHKVAVANFELFVQTVVVFPGVLLGNIIHFGQILLRFCFDVQIHVVNSFVFRILIVQIPRRGFEVEVIRDWKGIGSRNLGFEWN